MADRWAVASGNWSSTATWNGGTLPTASDDVFADGFTVTIDQDITVLSIRTTQRSGGTAGGGFSVSTTRSITANIIGGTTGCLTASGTAGNIVTIVGNISAGTSANATGLSITGGNNINVTGTVTGALATAGTSFGINHASTGTLTIVGNVNGGSGTGGGQNDGLRSTSTGAISITGNVTGGNGGSNGISNNSTATVTITGNVTGGSGSGSSNYGITNASSGTVVINGNITSTSFLAVINTTGLVTINGICYGSSRPPFLCTSTTGKIVVNGDIIASSSGPFLGEGITLISPSATLTHTYRTNNAGAVGAARSLYTGGQNLGQPTAANVRAGSTFGVSNEFTGTLVVPSAQFVALGTPVDSGVGTLQYLTMSDLQSALQSNAPTVNERTLSDTNSLSFSWPVSGVITGQVSKNNGAYANVQGAISYLRFEGNRHYYTLAYNAADRPTQEGIARYKFTDGTYTRYANLRVYPAPNNTAIESINSRLPANPASAQQITSLQNNAPTEIF